MHAAQICHMAAASYILVVQCSKIEIKPRKFGTAVISHSYCSLATLSGILCFRFSRILIKHAVQIYHGCGFFIHLICI